MDGGGSVAKLGPTLAIPRTVAHQTPLSMGFSRQEYWSGLPFPCLRNLPNPGIEPWSPALQADSLPAELPRKPWSWYIILLFGRVWFACIFFRIFPSL